MLLIIIILVGVIIYLLRRGSATSYGPSGMHYPSMGGFGSGMGGMMTGALLGYLLSESLISHHQYDSWQNMDADDLRQTLADQGIMTSEQFDDASQQLATNSSSWNDSQEDVPFDSDSSSDSWNDFNDFGGDGDSF
ncbi:hypothetical protein Ga0466249_004604 [Sporomusaceae bacterium BoRhaA]|uniref:hypothetical protein n=1 Tax=Pelorhabdus rhamnosifermentans TaxID=2772457 RepID=UPI001C060F9D|nr:hypothetical protein [Pelorhabdus rhamnosifermentans]MBU2703459.1 hypothetical protein [Pelorhabdus rhamnosifermentans]